MKSLRFDISRKRLHPLWMIIGAIIGRALGLMGALDLSGWYFVKPAVAVMWQIFGALCCAFFASFLITSKAALQTKWALMGLGCGFAFAFYIGEISTLFPEGTDPGGLTSISVADGIVFTWSVMHASWICAIAGWIIGNLIARKKSQNL